MENNDPITREEFNEAISRLDKHIIGRNPISSFKGIAGILLIILGHAVVTYDQIGNNTSDISGIKLRENTYVLKETENAKHALLSSHIDHLDQKFNDHKTQAEKKMDQVLEETKSIRKELSEIFKNNHMHSNSGRQTNGK